MEKFIYKLLNPITAFAGTYDNNYIDALGKSAGLKTTGVSSIEETIAFFITLSLGFVGIILLVLTFRAGALWMTAQGDKKIIDNSRKTIIGCAAGLFLILSSYAISEFVITSVNKAQKNTSQFSTTTPTGGGGFSQTVCETNSECPSDAPYCTDKNWYTAQLGYCNCCDNNLPGKECTSDVNRHSYCTINYGTQYKCNNIGNGFNTSCVIPNE